MAFVLGAHRSGTSATARILNLLGVDLGRIPLEVAEDNAKGFWEHPEVVAINETVLALLGRRWNDAGPLPFAWWSMVGMAPQRAAIRRLVEEEFAGSCAFGIKDPRLCRLLPLWLVALKPLAVTPVFVLVVRHPDEVAASIGKRDRIPRHAGEALWLAHMVDAERHTRPYRRVFVAYEALLADWQTQARRIAATIRLSWPRAEADAAAEVERFLDPALRHFSAAASSGATCGSGWVMHAYRLMVAAACRETAATRQGFAALDHAFGQAQAVFGPLLGDARADLSRARQAIDALAASNRAAAGSLRALGTLEAELAERTAWAEATAADVAQRDEVIRELHASLAEQVRWARESADAVAARDGTIRELQRLLEEQTRAARNAMTEADRRADRVAGLEAALAEQTRRAEASGAELADRDRMVQELGDRLAYVRRRVLRKHLTPCIEALCPAWTEAGKGFNVQPDGQACLAVTGHGFGPDAVVVVAGSPLHTVRGSARLLTAAVPPCVFRRPGLVAVWVDNREGPGSVSPIRAFRVLSTRVVAASRPAVGRRRRGRDAYRRSLRLVAAAWSRLQRPRLYLERAVGWRRRFDP
jgi:hypothetical protein